MYATYCTIIHKVKWFPVAFYQFRTNSITSEAIH